MFEVCDSEGVRSFIDGACPADDSLAGLPLPPELGTEQKSLHTDFLAVQSIAEHPVYPVFFAQNVTCELIRDTEPLAALAEVYSFVPVNMKCLLQMRRQTLAKARTNRLPLRPFISWRG